MTGNFENSWATSRSLKFSIWMFSPLILIFKILVQIPWKKSIFRTTDYGHTMAKFQIQIPIPNIGIVVGIKGLVLSRMYQWLINEKHGQGTHINKMGGDKSETSIKHILIEVRSFLIVSNPTITDFTMLRNYKIFQRTKKKCNYYKDQCFFKLTVLRSDSMKRNYGRFIFTQK